LSQPLLFDPAKKRVELDREDVGYRTALAIPMEKAIRVGGVAHLGAACLNEGVEALLIGYDSAAEQLLGRAHKLLVHAVEQQEIAHDHQPHGTEALRLNNLALAKWVLFNQHDQADLDLSVKHEALYLKTTKVSEHKVEISLVLPDYVNAGAFRQAVALYLEAGFVPPAKVAGILTEAQMSYVISRHALGADYALAETEAALHAFLRRNVNEWLTRGNFSGAAMWMKIARWNGRTGVTAKQAIMACYDYLPGVEPPTDRR
jgi:hypothetical protein